jgi:hypothetical protein
MLPTVRVRSNSDYDNIDLTSIPNDYLQRCNYFPACTIEEYVKNMPMTGWGNNASTYRIIMRNMFNQGGERTLIPTIAVPETGHVHAVYEIGFRNIKDMALAQGVISSLPLDFYVKITGKGSGGIGVISCFPFIGENNCILFRSLLLNCLTKYYAHLWETCWRTSFVADSWSKPDPRLRPQKFTSLTPEWTWDTPLRTDYERRQALVEIDVLTSLALGMTLEQLKTIYRIQFPVLQSYEADTWYDRNGRIVFTNNRSLTGVGYPRPEWEAIKEAKFGTFTRTITDDTQPGGPVERTIEYIAPFDRCDREQDYETAWAFFAEKYKQNP